MKTQEQRPHIEVAAGIIRRERTLCGDIPGGGTGPGTEVFASQRGYGDFKDGWEFPGGKLEEGETAEQALIREIREELDADIRVDKFLCTVEWDYPLFHLTMHCFFCSLLSGSLHLLEHEAARWVDAAQLKELDWLPADRAVLPYLLEELR